MTMQYQDLLSLKTKQLHRLNREAVDRWLGVQLWVAHTSRLQLGIYS